MGNESDVSMASVSPVKITPKSSEVLDDEREPMEEQNDEVNESQLSDFLKFNQDSKVVCDGCEKPFVLSSFFKHVSHPANKQCKEKYGQNWETISTLRQKSRSRTNSALHRQKNPDCNSQYWKDNKPRLSQRNKDSYAKKKAQILAKRKKTTKLTVIIRKSNQKRIMKVILKRRNNNQKKITKRIQKRKNNNQRTITKRIPKRKSNKLKTIMKQMMRSGNFNSKKTMKITKRRDKKNPKNTRDNWQK